MKTEQQPLPPETQVEIIKATGPRRVGRRGVILKGLQETELPDGTREPLYEVLFEDGPEIEVWWARPEQLIAI